MRHLVAALVILIAPSAVAAEESDYRALDVHALLDSITDGQRAQFHIGIAEWRSASATVPASTDHAYILGSLEGVATYNPDSTIVTAGLSILPTTYVIRIPASWNGRVVFYGPPGFLNHLFFAAHYAELMKQGYATVMVYAAVPGTAGFPHEQFGDGYHTHDTVTACFSTALLVKDLLGAAFASPLKTYALSLSGGTLWFAGLIVGLPDNPIDGYVMVVGGNGWRTETDEHMRAYRTNNRVPLTKQPTGVVQPMTGAVFDLAVNTEIGIADPEYRAFILAGGGYDALVAYDSSKRPAAVQQAWEELTFKPTLQTPVIVVQGTGDTTQYVRNSLVYTQRVIDAGRKDRLRLYLVPGVPHKFPALLPGLLEAVDQMKHWVEDGTPPGDITFGTPTGDQVVQNNWDAGYADDPCGYFHHQFDQIPKNCGL
jgi:hypothetical protein